MNKAVLPTPPKQLALDLGIEIQKDIDGIEMGVLDNGIPFLTQRGLSKISGIAHSVLYDIAQEWEENFDDPVITKNRISYFKEYLFKHGYTEPKLYIETVKDGTTHYAYPDIVCTAVLEYYAFEARKPNQTALDNYRKLAAYGMRKYIYEALDYQPGDKWKYHHDRVSILQNSVPQGYFSVFNEITGLIVDLISADLTVNHKTIPDISVGRTWTDYWKKENLEATHGQRIKYEHNYPSYYPQAASNPQIPFAYPDSALPAFRNWFRQEYLTTRFPKYILTKAKLLKGGKTEALAIGSMYKEDN